MTNLLPSIFTIVIDGKPILVFEAKNLREAFELCYERWLESDLAEARSEGLPLWVGTAKIRARIALPEESALFAEAQNSGQPSDGLMLVYARRPPRFPVLAPFATPDTERGHPMIETGPLASSRH